jgi:hypothetical protein
MIPEAVFHPHISRHNSPERNETACNALDPTGF